MVQFKFFARAEEQDGFVDEEKLCLQVWQGKREITLVFIYDALKEERSLDEVLEMLDKTVKRIQKVFEESKEIASKQTAVYEETLQSKDASEAQKVKAFIGRAIELDRLESLSAQLSLLYTLQIFAFKVKVLEIAVGNINEQLARSGVFEKHLEIEDIKKNIDALKILVEAQFESLKDIREKQSKDLRYIF